MCIRDRDNEAYRALLEIADYVKIDMLTTPVEAVSYTHLDVYKRQLYAGSAMAAKIPMIATTIMSSIKVKPCCFFMG